jgi:RNA polymerase sigma factor (sigma-70 family)
VGDHQTLWEAAVPLVRYVVKRLDVYGPHDREDLIAEGTLAAGVAIRAWNPIDVAFSTWVCNCVRNRLIAYIDREREHDTRRVQQDVEQMAGDAPEPELDATRVAEFLALVPFPDAQLLRKHFGIGCAPYTVSELAVAHDVSSAAVTQALQRALANLREAMCAS